MTSTRILISAGEESGDLHGGNLVAAFKSLRPDIEFHGLGGQKMRQAGVRTFFNIDRMGGMGFFEQFDSFYHHWQVYRKLAAEAASGQYCAAILVHYPLFNLILAKACRDAGVPVYFFIGPQVWAWRKGRLKKIRRRVDKMYVILPFEEQLYRDADIEVEFAGHPFIDLVRPTRPREDALREFGLNPELKTVGLLPGSRMHEIDSLLAPMIRAAERIKSALPGCQFLLPVADTIDPAVIRERLTYSGIAIKTVTGQTYDVMSASDFLICASGSATLEAGLLGTPMVIVYKLRPWTYWAGKWFIRVKNFGLINIVAGEEIVPELLQGAVTPERLAREALSVLNDPARAAAIRARLLQVRAQLGAPGVAARLARSIVSHLQYTGTI